jgi:hypothetical protein
VLLPFVLKTNVATKLLPCPGSSAWSIPNNNAVRRYKKLISGILNTWILAYGTVAKVTTYYATAPY